MFSSSGVAVQPGLLGTNTFFAAQPELVEDSSKTDVVAVVINSEKIIRFDRSGDTYTVRKCNSEDFSLTWSASECQFTFTDNCSSNTTYAFGEGGEVVKEMDDGLAN